MTKNITIDTQPRTIATRLVAAAVVGDREAADLIEALLRHVTIVRMTDEDAERIRLVLIRHG